jgi:hypothetical protein
VCGICFTRCSRILFLNLYLYFEPRHSISLLFPTHYVASLLLFLSISFSQSLSLSFSRISRRPRNATPPTPPPRSIVSLRSPRSCAR